MIRNSILLVILAIILIFNGGFAGPSKYEGKIVKKIEFLGLKNIDPDDLLDICITEKGFPLKASEIREDIKAVFKEGKFQDVKVEVEEYRDGVRVRFLCNERPTINEVRFKGVEELSDIEISEIISVKEGDVLQLDKLEKTVKVIKKKYEDEGFFNAVIKYQVEKVKDEENIVDVVYIIDEGEEIKVEKISILGTRKILSEDLLDIMETKEDEWFSDGTFKQDIYEQDKGKVIAYYKENGYLDADIVEDKVEYEWKDPEEMEERAIFITLKVIEGEKYYFGKYSVQGNKVIKTDVFHDSFEQRQTGNIFNDTLFQKDRHMISFRYATKGYIFARVIPKRTVEEREVEVNGKKETRKFVSVDFHIREGSQAYIENIIIKGNKKTKDKVIRRELIVKEGELFNSSKIQLSRERIFNLGFFKQVNFDIRPGSREGYMNLIIDVEEQPTGTISLGGGYSTRTKFSIFADVGENNLMGNGQRVGVRFEYGPKKSAVTLSFKEPWLFDYPISFTASIFYELYKLYPNSIFSTGESAEYQRQALGYSFGLSYRFWYYYGIGSIWRHSFKNILFPSGNCPDEVFLEKALGLQQKRTITLYTYRDSKDNFMNPTKGWRAELSASFTGGYIIRGDEHFIKYSPDLYYYYSPFHLPLLKTHPCVFEFRFNSSFITPPFQRKRVEKMQPREDNEWLGVGERLEIGGPETLRGWNYTDFQDSWQEGLFHRILYGVEFRLPVHPQMLWIAFFFDAGSLWTDKFWEKNLSESLMTIIDEDKQVEDIHTKEKKLYDIRDISKVKLMSYFRYSYGFGFKIQVPMMPLRFWFGKKLKWVGKDDGYFREIGGFEFQFGIGDMRF